MIPMCLLRFPLIRRSMHLAGPERTILMLLLILDTIVTLIVPERSSPAEPRTDSPLSLALSPEIQAQVHRMHHDPSRIQLCTLMNIKSEFSPLPHPVRPHTPFVRRQRRLTPISPLNLAPCTSRWMPGRLLLLLPIHLPQGYPDESHPARQTRPGHRGGEKGQGEREHEVLYGGRLERVGGQG